MNKKVDFTKITLWALAILSLATIFMAALTFNLIGNSIHSLELILGFVLASITFIASVMLGFYINKNKVSKWSYLLFLVLFVVAIVAIVFGTIGYIEKS